MEITIDLDKLAKLVDIQVTALPEDITPDESYGSDPDVDFSVDIAQINSDLQWNQWAWCCVRVDVMYCGVRTHAYLGGCSYKSKEDFIQSNDYYSDMLYEALSDLAKELVKITEATILLAKCTTIGPAANPNHCQTCNKYGCHDSSHQLRNNQLAIA